ncbi:hypothetical protein ACFY0A_36160 [Streptomyces sp. NPDC001698]|uniref:hypothetical protein n=1 Tax=Streptomyces sp. NPDC001698 TaxID=3364601 RepID=UPI003683D1F9
MTSGKSQKGALRPVESAPGVLVHPAADRLLAAEHWLLSAHPRPKQARAEWDQHGVALLPLGTLFSAVRIPGALIHAVADTTDADEVDAFLKEALADGPVICNPRHLRYYALVPGSMPLTWRQAADDWRVQDVDCLGRGCYLGVPPLRPAKARREADSYWSVPMPSPAILCRPLTVARLIAAGAHQLAEAAEPAKPRAVEP